MEWINYDQPSVFLKEVIIGSHEASIVDLQG